MSARAMTPWSHPLSDLCAAGAAEKVHEEEAMSDALREAALRLVLHEQNYEMQERDEDGWLVELKKRIGDVKAALRSGDGWTRVEDGLPEPNREVWCWRRVNGRDSIHLARRRDMPLSTDPDPSRWCAWYGDLSNQWSDVTVAGWAPRWAQLGAPPLPHAPEDRT